MTESGALIGSVQTVPGPRQGTGARAAFNPIRLAKRGVQGVLQSIGYHIAPFPVPHSYEPHIKALLSALDINLIIDVGAHTGEFYQVMRQLGYSGHIVSFEPVPDTFVQLSHTTTADPNWRGYNVALGPEAGLGAINVPDSHGFASFLRPNRYCERRFPYAHWGGSTIEVRIERLESLYTALAREIKRPRVFLKLDTQGWDIPVLEGAGSALADVVMLQSEVSVIPIYHGMHSIVQSLAHYYELGFSVTNLFPVSFDVDGERVIEYDCVMRRDVLPVDHPG
jgi:FkbM family methyltransferase